MIIPSRRFRSRPATYVWRVFPTEIQGEYSWTGILEPNSGEDVTIVPLFQIKADAQTREHGVWTGRVEEHRRSRLRSHRSETDHAAPVSVEPVPPPGAQRRMKADRTWINKKDPEGRCTPLDHASRFRFVEVVEWLLANGADVDAGSALTSPRSRK